MLNLCVHECFGTPRIHIHLLSRLITVTNPKCNTPNNCNFLLLGIINFLKYFDKKVQTNVMDYFYLIIKRMRGIRIEVDVERVFADPQGE